jgi:hypothetical protein
VPRVLSFPFRLGSDSGIATVVQGSDAEIDEAVAVALLVNPGERIQVPTFGVADPAYQGFEVGALQRHLNDFGPPVDVAALDVRLLDDAALGDREEVTVVWARRDTPIARTTEALP